MSKEKQLEQLKKKFKDLNSDIRKKIIEDNRKIASEINKNDMYKKLINVKDPFAAHIITKFI
jgi:hypothetical protein